MKRRARRTAAVLLVLSIVLTAALVAGYLYLGSGHFREALRARLIEAVESQTSLECAIASIEIDRFRFGFAARGIRLEPAKGTGGPLRLEVKEISAGVRLRSLLSRRVHLSRLTVVQPRIAVRGTGSSAGWNPESILKTVRVSLDLEASRFELRDGVLEIDNRKVPLSFSLDALQCGLVYADGPPRYALRLGYRNGSVRWADHLIRHDLDARGVLSMAGIDIESIAVRRERTLSLGKGRLVGWERPVLELHSTSGVAGEDFTLFHSTLRDIRGVVEVVSDLRWTPGSFRLAGSFTGRSASYRRVSIESMSGRFELDTERLLLRDVVLSTGRGKVEGNGTVQFHSNARRKHEFQLRASRLALSDAAKIIGFEALALANEADGAFNLRWLRGVGDFDADGLVRLYGGAPVEGGVRATALAGTIGLECRSGDWSVSKVDLTSPDSRVVSVDEGAPGFRVHIRTSRADELTSLLRPFIPVLDREMSESGDAMPVFRTLELDGLVSFSPERDMWFSGKGRATGAQWRGQSVDEIEAGLRLDENSLALAGLRAKRGAETVSGDLDLDHRSWSGGAGDFVFKGEVHAVSLASLRGLGLDVSPDIEGRLTAVGTISSTGDRLSGGGRLAAEGLKYKGEPIDMVRGELQFSDGGVRVSDGQIRQGKLNLNVSGRVALETREFDLEARLDRSPLTEVPWIQARQLNLDGTFAGNGKLTGTYDSPVFQGRLDVDGLKYEGWDLGRGSATLGLSNGEILLRGTVRSELGGFDVNAAVSTSSGHPGRAVLDFRDWNAQRLLSGTAPEILEGISTALQGRVQLEGRFGEPASLVGKGELDGARVRIRDYELRNEGKIRFSVGDLRVRIEEVKIAGEGTALTLNGALPLEGTQPIDLRLSGKLNLRAVEAAARKFRISGTAGVDVRASGRYRSPEVIGRVALAGARLDHASLPSPMTDIRGDLVFFRNSVRLENIRGTLASGSFGCSGYVEHENATIRALNLSLVTRGSRVSFPRDFRTLFDSDLALRGTAEAPVLSGEVRIARSEFIREFNLLEQMAAGSVTTAGPLTNEPFLTALRLDVTAVSESGLVVDNELARLQGGVRMVVRGTPAFPVIAGRIDVREGSIYFRGNRFDVMRGHADFADRNRINPTLDVRAEADVKSYRLLLEVRGPLDHLQFSLSSDPPMSTVDIVSLLTTGKPRDSESGGARRQAEITGLSAASILSEEVTGVIGRRVKRIFGLDSFRVDPFLAGAENDATARVTISQRISRDLSVVFSRNLSTNEEQIVVVEYDVTRNVSVVATRDEDGKFGLDFRIRKRFR